MAKTKKQKQVQSKPVINTDFLFIPGTNVKILIYSAIVIVSFILSFIYIFSAYKTNGVFGFPLDDPWIHLTFARNLVDYHSYSYFKNEMVTAGSTSPIYTLLLAAGFYITSNEMILSYILGIAFLIFSSLYFYKLTSFEFGKEGVYALLVTAVFLADKWMNFISGSGMETTMFIFILIATAYFYRQRKIIPFGIFLSLILWARPDGLAFIGALVIDIIIKYYFSKTDSTIKLFSKNDFMKIGIIAVLFITLYVLMNYLLSGSLLPNTYNAKLTYYAPEFRSRLGFLKYEVWGYYTTGAYGLIMFGFFMGMIFAILDIIKKKYNNNLLYILFIFIFVFIYWYKLPFAAVFGRYMMPVIPFLILVSSLGFKNLFKSIGRYLNNKTIAIFGTVAVFGLIIVFSFQNYLENKSKYIYECNHITERQVTAAKWIRDNTNENDIIATHDVGAIGFYSKRKIVDVAGLVTPDLINKISDDNYVSVMNEYLKKNGVTYLAFLREWYRVVNQSPLISTQELSPVEIMEVFKYDPTKTKILSKMSNGIIMEVQNRLSTKNPQQYQAVGQLLNKSLQYDPTSSLTFYYLGILGIMTNDIKNAEVNLLKSVELYPDFKDAILQLGIYYKRNNKNEEAQKYLEKYLLLNPGDQKVKDMLKEVTNAPQNGQK